MSLVLSIAVPMRACRRLDIRKFLDGIYVSEKGLVVKAE